MGFDKLVLNSATLAALYGDSIVLAGTEAVARPVRTLADGADVRSIDEPGEATTAPGYALLGQNAQHISIIVETSGKSIVPANHLKFLTKMLEACRLTLDDVAILNHAQNPVDQKLLREQLSPKSVVLFGITAGDIGLPLDFPLFQLYNYDGVGYLQVPALAELNGDTEQAKLLKTKLWVCLRQLFQV